MNNNRTIITFILIAILLPSIFMLKKYFSPIITSKWTVAILQTASHPALDAARDGFIDRIKQELGNDVTIITRNAEGSITTLHTIAQQFHARSDIDAIYAIATPAALTVASLETIKPIIISAVTVAPTLSITFDQTNVCGVSDMIDVHAEVTSMHTLLPHVKNVGVVFSAAEINAVAMAKSMITELENIGYNPIVINITSESEVEPAIMSALRKVDALIAPTDNIVASSIALIADLAQKAAKPLIVSDNMLVAYGPLMAQGVDYYATGKQAGEITLQILVDHKQPADMGIIMPESTQLFINTDTLNALQLTVPKSLQSQATFIAP
jgi:putative ABC transport system substrate-binding protein